MQCETAPAILRRGVPVYVEKPSANHSEQARELAELAAANGVWGIDSAHRAMLIGQLCHMFDLVRYFGGDVSHVQALFHQASATQFAWTVNLRFASGAIGQMDLNSLAHRAGFRDIVERLEIVGLENHVTCDDMQRLKWTRPDDFLGTVPGAGRYVQSFEPAWPAMRSNARFGYLGEVAHFAKRCLGQVDGGPDLWDSYEALRIGEAVYESGEDDGAAVAIPSRGA